MQIAANKVAGVRAALAWNEETSALTRKNNNANVVAVGAHTTSPADIEAIIRAFLGTDFEGGRHQQRIEKISHIEKQKER